jgi:peptide/nickel transport system substrate-binding protein
MRRFFPLILCLFTACDRSNSASGAAGGTVIIATPADADALVPPIVRTSAGRLASELLFDRLAEMGPERNTVGDAGFAPRLARSWSWSADSLSIAFELDPRARWHDGQPVVAADVIASLRAIRDSINGSGLRSDVTELDSISATSTRVATFHFRRRGSEQFYSASLIVPLPAHLLPPAGTPLAQSDFARAPVGSGPFKFGMWEPQARLELRKVEEHYRRTPLLDRVVLSVSPEVATGLGKLWAGEADVWEQLPAADLAEAARHPHLRVNASFAFDYGYVAFNLRDARTRAQPHALFVDRELRRAISMAVDRAAVVRAIFDTLAFVSSGPFVLAQHTADTTLTQIPADPAMAGALLDSLGWRRGSDGVRRKAGRRLTFTALVPGTSRNRERAAVLIQEQLRLVGIDMQIERAENRTFTQKRQEGAFDVVFGGWLTTPSPRGIRGTWGSVAHGDGWGALNDGRYENRDVDAAIEQGLAALNPTEARAHFRRAYQMIVDDAPALFLYEPRTLTLVHTRFIVPTWRPEAWWRTLEDWSVNPDARLPRDAPPTSAGEAR